MDKMAHLRVNKIERNGEKMKIAIGNDHAATELKFVIMDYLKELGHEVINFGTDGTDSCNYPEYGEKSDGCCGRGGRLRSTDLRNRSWNFDCSE